MSNPKVDIELAFRYATGQINEQQYNFFIVTQHLDREQMDQVVEFHKKGLSRTGFVLTLVFFSIMVIIGCVVGQFLTVIFK